MTWLQGTTTWGALVPKLAQLACGEVADDLSVTCATGDRWVRDISTSYDLIRTPAALDINTGTLHMRAGYWTALSYRASLAPNSYSWLQTVCKQTAIWSGVPTGIGANSRWTIVIGFGIANTVASNYSTARFSWVLYDADTGGVINSGTANPLSTTGDATLTVGGRTFGINVTDPSGIIPVGAMFYRSFTATYLGGVDWFGPYYCRRTGNPTFTVNPPGTAGTDYDTNVDIACAATAMGSAGVFGASQGTAISTPYHAGGWLSGVGIKTNAGLTGAQYAFSFNMALAKIRMWAASGANNGQINCDYFGGGALDSGTYRRMGGYTDTATSTTNPTGCWMRPFATPGSVLSSSQVQYWMSVKQNKIIIILNGDPGASGNLTNGGVFTYTPYDYLGAGYDKFPVLVSRTATNTNLAGDAIQFHKDGSYFIQAFHQDGSEARDWQDKWLRYDSGTNTVTYANNQPSTDQIGILYPYSSTGVAPTTPVPGLYDTSGSTGYGPAIAPLVSTKPNAITGKWRMYGFTVEDRNWWNNFYGTQTNVAWEDDYPKGYVAASVTSPFLYIPTGQFATGDELTDTVSGAKFFLCVHSTASGYFGLLGAMTGGGGVAVLEN